MTFSPGAFPGQTDNEEPLGRHFCRIIEQRNFAEDLRLLVAEGEGIVQSGRPGQFIHILLTDGWTILWRRPFSIHRVHPRSGTFEILYRVVGPGTRTLSEKKPGDVLDLLGPLGKGFDLDGPFEHGLIVAGGVGSAGLFFVSDVLLEKKKRVTFLWGARNKAELDGMDALRALRRSGADVRISTDNGSEGLHGPVTELLKKTLAVKNAWAVGTAGFVCGPQAMMPLVQEIVLKTDFPWQASLEEKMACGVDACKGCAVRMKRGGFQMVCSDGPVFDLREVSLDR